VRLRQQISAADFLPGQFVPSARKLARDHAVDVKTAFRAMKSLEAEGLLRAVPGRGFRVVAEPGRTEAGGVIAYVGARNPGGWAGSGTTIHLAHALQGAAARRGQYMMSVPRETPHKEIVATLRNHGVSGTVVSSFDRELVSALVDAGINVVLVDSLVDCREVDTVVQDGQVGGLHAVDYVLQRGRKRAAWLGNADGESHLADRLSGVMAGLRIAGRPMADDLIAMTNLDEAEDAVRRFLERKEPADAIFALWTNYMLAAARACRSLGLKLGEDLDLVGWCSQEVLKHDMAGQLSAETASAVVTWSTEDMAEAALARLVQRREQPNLPAVRIRIPTRLIETRPARNAP
jgi:DNA-binding LacI/PurR family transcriptional regulator